MELTLELELKVRRIREKVRSADISWSAEIEPKAYYQKLLKSGLVTAKELALLKEADAAIMEAIKVDIFDDQLKEVMGGV